MLKLWVTRQCSRQSVPYDLRTSVLTVCASARTAVEASARERGDPKAITETITEITDNVGTATLTHGHNNYVVSRSFTFLLGWAGPPCGLGLAV